MKSTPSKAEPVQGRRIGEPKAERAFSQNRSLAGPRACTRSGKAACVPVVHVTERKNSSYKADGHQEDPADHARRLSGQAFKLSESRREWPQRATNSTNLGAKWNWRGKTKNNRPDQPVPLNQSTGMLRASRGLSRSMAFTSSSSSSGDVDAEVGLRSRPRQERGFYRRCHRNDHDRASSLCIDVDYVDAILEAHLTCPLCRTNRASARAIRGTRYS